MAAKVPVNSFGGMALFDANEMRRNREHYRYDDVPELGAANSIYVSSDRYPVRGWILLRRSDYNKLSPYGTYNLVLQDFGKQVNAKTVNQPVTFLNLVIVQARCVSRGVAADPNAIYLVEITDPQGILWNEWFRFPTQSQFNMRAPAYPEQFYTASLNGGTPFTWNQMVNSLWLQMGTFLGPYPGLPTTPAGTPEGWSFPGVSAWEAMNRILGYLGLVVTTNLTLANPYSIAVFGGTDTYNSALAVTNSSALEDDWEYIDAGLGRVPKQVVVLFHRRNQFYGTEETVRLDSLQWSSTPIYSVTVPGSFPLATGTGYIWSDYAVAYDVDGNPLAASVATANAIAVNVAANYYNKITRSTQGFLKQQYIGALPFATGGLVDGVCWRQDKNESDKRKGWVTVIVRGPDPPFAEVDYAD